jgi:hypothetical protein
MDFSHLPDGLLGLCVAHKAIKWESPVTNETEISP